jgi:uncharacterized protein (DUF2236 family)
LESGVSIEAVTRASTLYCMKDEGYFGPHSMAWRVHSNPVTLVGGVRALLIQALHPLAMAGILEHSVVTGDISGRYMRTRDFVLAAIFGDRATADEAGARVRAAHRPVAGVDKVTGKSYRATDPELLLWVHCALVDSFLAAQQRFGRRLDGAEADLYVAEMMRMGRLVGLRDEDMPVGRDDLRNTMASYDPMLRRSDGADATWRLLEHPPMPLAGRPVWALVFAASVSILPPKLLRLYGRSASRIPASALSAGVTAGARFARMIGRPSPVFAAARELARAEGVRL